MPNKPVAEFTAVEVVRQLLHYMEDGTIVRSCVHDYERDWAFRMADFVALLARANQIVTEENNGERTSTM